MVKGWEHMLLQPPLQTIWSAFHTRRDEESSSLQLYLGAHSTQLNVRLEQVDEVGAPN